MTLIISFIDTESEIPASKKKIKCFAQNHNTSVQEPTVPNSIQNRNEWDFLLNISRQLIILLFYYLSTL